jgi:hypothetical protein
MIYQQPEPDVAANRYQDSQGPMRDLESYGQRPEPADEKSSPLLRASFNADFVPRISPVTQSDASHLPPQKIQQSTFSFKNLRDHSFNIPREIEYDSLEQERRHLYQERPRFASIAPLERLEPGTLKNLADFFASRLEERQKQTLAGELVFPKDPVAAALFAELVGAGKLCEKDHRSLLARATYPGDCEAAAVKERMMEGQKEISLLDKLKLYALDAYPTDPRLANRLLKNLKTFFRNFKTCSPQEAAGPLIYFVRQEIYSAQQKVSDNQDLAELFGLPKKVIRQLLDNPSHGLTPQEHRYRQEKEILTRGNSNPLSLRIIQAVRNLVSVENELFKSGAVGALSSRGELRALFGLSKQRIQEVLRFLHSDDFSFREEVFGRKGLQDKIQELKSQVELELLEQSKGGRKELTSDGALAETYQISPVAVFRHLREHLAPDAFQRRQLLLRDRIAHEPHLTAPAAFVVEELRAFERGEIEAVSSDMALSEIFQVTPHAIYEFLSPVQKGLNPEQFREREIALALQHSQDIPTLALRLVMTQSLRERILRYSLKSVAKNHHEPRAGDSLTSGKLVYKGASFDSCEEAACAILLQKYIPGFSIQKGVTFQVKADQGIVDFVLPRGVVVEYHPIRAYWSAGGSGGFSTREEYEHYRAYKAEFKKISKAQHHDYVEHVKNQLLESYRQERQLFLSRERNLSRHRLIVVTSAKSFYYSVIETFGRNIPGEKAFLKEFRKLTAQVKTYNATRVATSNETSSRKRQRPGKGKKSRKDSR